MNTDKLLDMLLEAIDYSFLQTDGSYDTTLTYPVIDKVKYIKRQINDNKAKEADLERKEVIDEENGMTQKDQDYLVWRCKTNWHKKYHRYINEWINNVLPIQLEYFRKEMNHLINRGIYDTER